MTNDHPDLKPISTLEQKLKPMLLPFISDMKRDPQSFAKYCSAVARTRSWLNGALQQDDVYLAPDEMVFTWQTRATRQLHVCAHNRSPQPTFHDVALDGMMCEACFVNHMQNLAQIWLFVDATEEERAEALERSGQGVRENLWLQKLLERIGTCDCCDTVVPATSEQLPLSYIAGAFHMVWFGTACEPCFDKLTELGR